MEKVPGAERGEMRKKVAGVDWRRCGGQRRQNASEACAFSQIDLYVERGLQILESLFCTLQSANVGFKGKK